MTNRYDNDKMYSAFVDTIVYNFGLEVFEALLTKVKEAAETKKSLACFDYEDLELFDINEGLNQIWCMLVLMFGDYGTSPRVGWLNPTTELIQFLEDVVSDLREIG